MKRVKLKKSVYGAEKRILPGGVWSGQCVTRNGNIPPTKAKQRDEIAAAVSKYKGKQRRLVQSFNKTRAKIIARHMRKANGRAAAHQV